MWYKRSQIGDKVVCVKENPIAHRDCDGSDFLKKNEIYEIDDICSDGYIPHTALSGVYFSISGYRCWYHATHFLLPMSL